MKSKFKWLKNIFLTLAFFFAYAFLIIIIYAIKYEYSHAVERQKRLFVECLKDNTYEECEGILK